MKFYCIKVYVISLSWDWSFNRLLMKMRISDNFLFQEQQLRAIRLLPNILRLHRLLLQRLNRCVDSSEATRMKIREFLDDITDGKNCLYTSVTFSTIKWHLFWLAIVSVYWQITSLLILLSFVFCPAVSSLWLISGMTCSFGVPSIAFAALHIFAL